MNSPGRASLALVTWLVIEALACPAVADQAAAIGDARNGITPLINPDISSGAKAAAKTAPASDRDPVMVQNDQLKTRAGFGAQFWVTDSEEFFLNWLRADAHNLVPVTTTRRDEPLFLALFVVDPGTLTNRDGEPRCNVTYDYEVIRPDGGRFSVGKNYVAWASRPPPSHIVQLAVNNTPEDDDGDHSAEHYPRVMFGIIDPPGEYIVNMMVHDNVRKIDIPLQRRIVLKE